MSPSEPEFFGFAGIYRYWLDASEAKVGRAPPCRWNRPCRTSTPRASPHLGVIGLLSNSFKACGLLHLLPLVLDLLRLGVGLLLAPYMFLNPAGWLRKCQLLASTWCYCFSRML